MINQACSDPDCEGKVAVAVCSCCGKAFCQDCADCFSGGRICEKCDVYTCEACLDKGKGLRCSNEDCNHGFCEEHIEFSYVDDGKVICTKCNDDIAYHEHLETLKNEK